MKRLILAFIALVAIGVVGCSDDETTNPATSTLKLSMTGLEDLGAGYQYEGWIIVNGTPVSTGTFTVSSTGQLSKTDFEVNANNLTAATTFVLTIEPVPDNDPMPSDVHVLAGDFSGSSAGLAISHAAALGNDFSATNNSTYILATPTNGDNTNENSGIWFLDTPTSTPSIGLKNLPMLPAGWKYEGWVVVNGTPVSSGTFTAADMMDDSAPYSGTMSAPPFPGEDYLQNAPSGLTFPTDLAGGMAVISIEPSPDNSPNPFTLKPLVGSIPANATPMTVYTMGYSASSFPTGTATK